MSDRQNQKPRGTDDLFKEDLLYHERLMELCKKVAREYGFERIRLPYFEEADLYTRGIGESTDVVSKEMYTLDQGTRKLALRPELTAGIVRAYLENGMKSWPKPIQLWALGPAFRHERPQAGRYRQFWQFDVEVFGRKAPVVDVHIMQLFYSLLKEIGFEDLRIRVNSIGCSRCRARYKEDLKEHLQTRKKDLCVDCQKRLKKNPLRILDCKKKKCREVTKTAPQVLDALWKKCRVHLKQVLEYMDELNLPYELDPYLVRGLDYYTRTVFEIVEPDNDNALVGGGRYDGLVKKLGGVSTPASGAAMGLERVIESIKEKELWEIEEEKPQFWLAQLGVSAKREALPLFEDLRRDGFWVAKDFSGKSLSKQLSKANEMGVNYVIILAKKELIDGEAIIKDMETEEQVKVKLKDIKKEIKKRLK